MLQGAGGLTALRRLIYGRSGAQGAGLTIPPTKTCRWEPLSHPFIPIGTTVLV
jgi:hypothetical protein